MKDEFAGFVGAGGRDAVAHDCYVAVSTCEMSD